MMMTLPIYRGWEQHGEGQEAGVKGTGSRRAGYGRREVLIPLSPHVPGSGFYQWPAKNVRTTHNATKHEKLVFIRLQ